MKPLPLGKIPIRVLQRTVLSRTGALSGLVETPARAGLDFTAVKLRGGYLLVSADPITGVADEIGRYAVNVSANDIATSGNRPQFMESVILLPEGASEASLDRVAGEMHAAARELGIEIVGGHTEVTPGLRRPIVVVTAFSVAKDYASSGAARRGDLMVMTKTAGMEGTAAIARRGGLVPAGLAARASRLAGRMSVVEEAVAAYATGKVRAMHDCTEGGVLGAAYEMSLASGLGFTLRQGAVPVAPETARVCSLLSLDPLRLIGSGSMLVAVRPESEGDVLRALEEVCRATVIGEFGGAGRRLVLRDGSTETLREAPEDELWRALGGLP